MEIRHAVESDIEQLALIEKDVMSCPWSKNNFLEALRQNYTRFLVAEEAGKIIGYVVVYLSHPEAELPDIVVAKECQGRGVGKLLLQQMLTELDTAGVTEVFLEVRESNGIAQKLYASNGFESCGIRKNFYENPVEHALCMCRKKC